MSFTYVPGTSLRLTSFDTSDKSAWKAVEAPLTVDLSFSVTEVVPPGAVWSLCYRADVADQESEGIEIPLLSAVSWGPSKDGEGVWTQHLSDNNNNNNVASRAATAAASPAVGEVVRVRLQLDKLSEQFATAMTAGLKRRHVLQVGVMQLRLGHCAMVQAVWLVRDSTAKGVATTAAGGCKLGILRNVMSPRE